MTALIRQTWMSLFALPVVLVSLLMLSCSERTVEFPLGEIAELVDLEVITVDGELVPFDSAFAIDRLHYNGTVGAAVDSVTAKWIKLDSNSVVTVDEGLPFRLKTGENTMTVRVVSEDGLTTRTYIVVLVREESQSADLASLKLSTGILTPAFDPSVTSYTLSLGNDVKSITATGTAADSKAKLSGDHGKKVSLKVGETLVLLTVTSGDGLTCTRKTDSYAALVVDRSKPDGLM